MFINRERTLVSNGNLATGDVTLDKAGLVPQLYIGSLFESLSQKLFFSEKKVLSEIFTFLIN